MAISLSVTVSIGDDTSGALSERFFVNGELKSTSSAVKFIKPGRMMKSLQMFGLKCEFEKFYPYLMLTCM